MGGAGGTGDADYHYGLVMVLCVLRRRIEVDIESDG